MLKDKNYKNYPPGTVCIRDLEFTMIKEARLFLGQFWPLVVFLSSILSSIFKADWTKTGLSLKSNLQIN